MNMDIQIVRAIIQSRGEVMEDVDDPEAFERSLMEEKFPMTNSAILAALTKSFTNLITHKVSPEAYQRYAVRIQVIEVLRDWLRPCKELQFSRAFSQGERILKFAARILRIYLKNEILFQDDKNIDVLVNLARALICLSPKNKTFTSDLEKLLDRITSLGQTEDTRRLVLSAVKEKDSLGLCFRTVERLYVCQSVKLVEEPLVDNFLENIHEPKDTATSQEFKSSCRIEELFKIIVESPTIFQIASSILKEILVHFHYSPKVIDYIKFFLKSLVYHSQKCNKNVLDLYPLHLQSCVLLLNIEPEQHTLNSREYVLQSLKKIHLSNPEETLILLSHFPSWLRPLSSHLDCSRIVTNMSLDDEL